MENNSTQRGLLRTLVWAGVIIFSLVLAWRFLAGVASAVLLLLLGVLLGVALSAPVEALRRWKVPRVVSSPLIVVGVLGALFLVGYLFLPHIGQQGSQLVAQLPSAINSLLNRIEQLASTLGLNLNLGGGGRASLVGFVRQAVGGILGLFSNLVFAIAGVVAATFLGIYLAATPAPVVEWLVRLFPPTVEPERERYSRRAARPC